MCIFLILQAFNNTTDHPSVPVVTTVVDAGVGSSETYSNVATMVSSAVVSQAMGPILARLDQQQQQLLILHQRQQQQHLQFIHQVSPQVPSQVPAALLIPEVHGLDTNQQQSQSLAFGSVPDVGAATITTAKCRSSNSGCHVRKDQEGWVH